jgi:hypothetical protein
MQHDLSAGLACKRDEIQLQMECLQRAVVPGEVFRAFQLTQLPLSIPWKFPDGHEEVMICKRNYLGP